jgi:hypothetical protein
VPSTGRVEQTSDEQGPQQQPRGEDASTNLHAKTLGETPAHQTNGHTRCRTPKHEKTVTEKATGPQAGEKTGGSVPTEKVNGSAIHDKGKRTRGEPPFTKREREEMEALLDELCGHLGQLSEGSAALQALTDMFNQQSYIQPDSWKVKTSRTTSCSTLTGCCRCPYTTRHNFILVYNFRMSIITHARTYLSTVSQAFLFRYPRLMSHVQILITVLMTNSWLCMISSTPHCATQNLMHDVFSNRRSYYCKFISARQRMSAPEEKTLK